MQQKQMQKGSLCRSLGENAPSSKAYSEKYIHSPLLFCFWFPEKLKEMGNGLVKMIVMSPNKVVNSIFLSE